MQDSKKYSTFAAQKQTSSIYSLLKLTDMKKFFLLAVAAIAAVGVYAQDVIVTRDAKRVEAKILEVSSSEIKYKEFSNPDGPTFVLQAAEINTIIYQNGTVKVFDQPKQAAPAPVYNSAAPAYSATAAPQATGMPITKNDKTYYMGEQRMTEDQYVAFIQLNCQQAYDRYMSGKKLRKSGWGMFTSGLVFIGCGSVLYGVGAGLTVDNARSGYYRNVNTMWDDPLFAGLCIPGTILLCTGSALFTASIPCIVVGTIRRNKSYEVYNETCARSTANAIEFGIQPAANGIGLSMRF